MGTNKIFFSEYQGIVKGDSLLTSFYHFEIPKEQLKNKYFIINTIIRHINNSEYPDSINLKHLKNTLPIKDYHKVEYKYFNKFYTILNIDIIKYKGINIIGTIALRNKNLYVNSKNFFNTIDMYKYCDEYLLKYSQHYKKVKLITPFPIGESVYAHLINVGWVITCDMEDLKNKRMENIILEDYMKGNRDYPMITEEII